MIGVEQRAEIRRLYFVEKRSKRAIRRLTGAHRDTITRALASETPPRYERKPTGSKLDPFKDWICEQLRGDPAIESQRLRELAADLGYRGGKTIFDDYVREVRPRYRRARTFQRTVYRPGELVQCDLWEPREPVPVGHGQTRRGYVVTSEVCWSRVLAGSLIFSKEAPDILWGLARNLSRLGVLPEKLVCDPGPAVLHRSSRRQQFKLSGSRKRLTLRWLRSARERRARSAVVRLSCSTLGLRLLNSCTAQATTVDSRDRLALLHSPERRGRAREPESLRARHLSASDRATVRL